MRSHAEAEVVVGGLAPVEDLGVLELLGVSIARADADHYPLAGLDRTAANHRVAGGDPAEMGGGGRVADDLVQRSLDQRGVGPDQCAVLRVVSKPNDRLSDR